MSDYEMASLHAELFNAIQSSIAVFLSILSGFLLLSYFAAHRLDRISAAVTLLIFAGYSAVNLSGTSGTLTSYAGLTHQIRERVASTGGLSWHNAAHMPGWLADILSPGLMSLGAVVLVASIRFFFHCRHTNRLKEANA
jgi:hypothetical protein